MTEQVSEIKRLVAIAADLGLSADLRIKSIDLLGKIGNREAFLALLELAANEGLIQHERDLALKRAREALKTTH